MVLDDRPTGTLDVWVCGQTTGETVPDEIAVILDQHRSHELMTSVVLGDTTYYVVEQFGEEEGSLLLVVRQTSGFKPELVSADRFSEGSDNSDPLAREVIEAMEAILGKPEDDTEEVTRAFAIWFAGATAGVGLTSDQVSHLLFEAAVKLSGHLSSRGVPKTQRSQLACACAVNEVARRGLGRDIGSGLLVTAMRKVTVACYSQFRSATLAKT